MGGDRCGKGLRVLVVEDEVLIALELECLLDDLGHTTIGVAASSREAIALGQADPPDVAFVDVHLVDGPTGVEVGRTLSADPRTTVVFMTANAKRVPDDYAGAFGIIAKPYTERVVASVLHYLCERRAGRTGDRPGPELSLDGFNLAPRARA
jgi:two-component system, response regulator PdtaR